MLSNETHPNLERFLWFINERHQIYLRRTIGCPKPWTADPILQNYRFCNVYRELDTTTQWIAEHIRVGWTLAPGTVDMNLLVARVINWVPTLQEIGYIHNWETERGRVLRVLRDRKERGEKVFTSAYMLRCDNTPKAEYTVNRLLAPIVERLDKAPWRRAEGGKQATLQRSTEWLAEHYGMGPFLAYEVVTDLRHTPLLERAPDICTWANPGPGAKRGLNRLFNRELKLNPKNAQEEMRNLMFLVNNHMAIGTVPALTQPFEMRDVEHCLCEYDKYVRVLTGQGTPRERYNGAA